MYAFDFYDFNDVAMVRSTHLAFQKDLRCPWHVISISTLFAWWKLPWKRPKLTMQFLNPHDVYLSVTIWKLRRSSLNGCDLVICGVRASLIDGLVCLRPVVDSSPLMGPAYKLWIQTVILMETYHRTNRVKQTNQLHQINTINRSCRVVVPWNSLSLF